MRVLDLFSGLGGWAKPFRDRGHDVVTLDDDPRFGCDLTIDVRRFAKDPRTFLPGRRWRPDLVVASPPCEKFSTLSFQRGYFALDEAGDPHPATLEAWDAIELVHATWDVVESLTPRWYVIENPRALLRQVMPFTEPPDHERRTVWYCHLGAKVAKPTDLWGRFPSTLVLPGPCHNRRPSHDVECCCTDHNAAPRGSRTGTQGPDSAAVRAKVPYRLGEMLSLACEVEL